MRKDHDRVPFRRAARDARIDLPQMGGDDCDLPSFTETIALCARLVRVGRNKWRASFEMGRKARSRMFEVTIK